MEAERRYLAALRSAQESTDGARYAIEVATTVHMALVATLGMRRLRRVRMESRS